MKKYLSRLTKSARGETFNPLIWPSLLCTLTYGIGFTLLLNSPSIAKSSLHIAMESIGPLIPVIWGALAVGTIILGLTFLLFNIPPAGKFSGIAGFMLWTFAWFAWVLTGGWFIAMAVAFPNMWFWFWQYLSLSHFRREDKEDEKFMKAYHAGEYDDDNGGRERRLNNRGVKRQ
jgi:hypothetical protein